MFKIFLMKDTSGLTLGTEKSTEGTSTKIPVMNHCQTKGLPNFANFS